MNQERYSKLENDLIQLGEEDEEEGEEDDEATGVETFLESLPSVKFPSFDYVSVREERVPTPRASEASLPLLEKKPSCQGILHQQTPFRASLRGSSLKLQTHSIELLIWALAPLAIFSIFGVIIRFLLEILFGPEVGDVTAENSPLFRDLPANMFGSFFMGWVGAVLKQDIAEFSELLAIGLSTGLMGSTTTFASWNQSMIAAITRGYWMQSLLGLLLGMELAQMSFSVGVGSAKGLKWLTERQHEPGKLALARLKCQVKNCHWQLGNMLYLLTGATLWAIAAALAVVDVNSHRRRKLWLSCVVAPLGTWARWFLAQLNGRGICLWKKRRLKWMPIGTLVTNVMAATIEAALALVQLLVGNQDVKLLSEVLQFGFLGCMSTVSTMVAEVYLLYKSPKRWRAFVYAFITISLSYTLGLLTYSCPVWFIAKK